MTEPLLKVRDLTVQPCCSTAEGLASAVLPSAILKEVNFDLFPAETVGLVGDSGAGKTTLARAILGLLTGDQWSVKGSVLYCGTELLTQNERDLRQVRGSQISLIFQEPELALSPMLRVGSQIDEVLRAHSGLSGEGRKLKVLSTLKEVGLAEPPIVTAYPHELSGGQRQRVVIGQSLVSDSPLVSHPRILIADEPTSSLDSATQSELLKLFKRLRDRFHVSLLFITHDLALLSGFANRTLYLRKGRIVEGGGVEVFRHSPPCSPEDQPAARRESYPQVSPLVEANQVRKVYVRKDWPSAQSPVVALDGVDLKLFARSSLALIGKSAAGKSTLGKCLAMIETPDSGEIKFRGGSLATLQKKQPAAIRNKIQIVFQHSAVSINPRFSALEAVAEPLLIQKAASKSDCRDRALVMLEQLGIPSSFAGRKSLTFSGGQRQRIAIARSLVLEPALLILDEALAGLDFDTKIKIADLLQKLQTTLAISYLFITHDLRMATYVADQLAVMQEGKIVESGSVTELLSGPHHEATRQLFDNVPLSPGGTPFLRKDSM